MNINSSRILAGIILLAVPVSPAFALQGLCENSPENPTVILGLLGAAAAGYPYVRASARRLLKRKTGGMQAD